MKFPLVRDLAAEGFSLSAPALADLIDELGLRADVEPAADESVAVQAPSSTRFFSSSSATDMSWSSRSVSAARSPGVEPTIRAKRKRSSSRDSSASLDMSSKSAVA